MNLNGKHLDWGLKIFLSLLVTLFIFLYKDTKEEVKENRKTIYELRVKVAQLEFRVEWLKVFPPSENPAEGD